MDHDALTFLVVCEAAADQRTGCTLADRVILEKSTWLDATVLDSVRQWRGLTPESTFISWAAVPREADKCGIQAHGHFEGKPGALDARAARRALFLVATLTPQPSGVLLIRDTDGLLERRQGLQQARDCGWSFVVVIGLPHHKRESWLIAAFDPSDDRDSEQLEALKKDLGFDPCQQSHNLTAQKEGAKRSAKRVLAALCHGDIAQAERWLADTPIEVLRTRGVHNGLADYFTEVEQRLVPLFQSRGSRR